MYCNGPGIFNEELLCLTFVSKSQLVSNNSAKKIGLSHFEKVGTIKKIVSLA
jgi:hypothetical protein